MAELNTFPDTRGYFGPFGGIFIPETLRHAVSELQKTYEEARQDTEFTERLDALFKNYVGRPSALFHAKRLSEHTGGAQIWFKREDLNHTGAHKINNALGQGLLTLRMGKKRVIAETGAGQHGVATATACALLGLECVVYMGEEDIRRQQPNVQRMQLLGAKVEPVTDGSRTLKDATNAAMRDWMSTSDTTHYIIGSVVGPHPYPQMVRDFQSVIGTECREQFMVQQGGLPDCIIACVGGGSNAAGIFYPFIKDESVQMIGVEAGGRGSGPGDHAAPLTHGNKGVLHGALTYVCQDLDGQTMPVHSISAGLDYPGVGPEHANWHESKRVEYTSIEDSQALQAFQDLARLEGLLPAIETSHAIAQAQITAKTMRSDQHVVVNLSGRGDKDLAEVVRLLGMDS